MFPPESVKEKSEVARQQFWPQPDSTFINLGVSFVFE